jgi:hypothetical protein
VVCGALSVALSPPSAWFADSGGHGDTVAGGFSLDESDVDKINPLDKICDIKRRLDG